MVALALVKPATCTLGTELQHASGRAVLQSWSVKVPVGVTVSPEVFELAVDQLRHPPLRCRP
jgi:hypothetical protein